MVSVHFSGATTYTSDGGQVSSKVAKDKDGAVVSTSGDTYHGSGNPLTETDGAGNTTLYTYDGGQVSTKVVKDKNGTVVSSTSYTYDLAGNVLTAALITDLNRLPDRQSPGYRPGRKPWGFSISIDVRTDKRRSNP
jgi:hypothetical protein